ncbi:MAG: radical SAM protein [Oscillospiraceae bacterium]|nr:radical SAM protein [Oscillospiraceae bacterium]
MKQVYEKCMLCPRECGVNRYTVRGHCGVGAEIKAARAALHHWEEPCISADRGSGTVFFSGCNLGCAYCQNEKISRGGAGNEISVSRLAEIFHELEEKGAHNINLVTPTHFVPSIIEALDIYRPNIPIVYNCGGYESIDTLKILNGYIDIYLTDIKYYSDEYAIKYSRAPGYFEIARTAALEMIRQCSLEYDGNVMTKGVIVRHLCLPGLRNDSIKVVEALAEFPKDSFVLSLMSQYLPCGDLSRFPELTRRVTSFEYNSVVSRAVELGLVNGYTQERGSAKDVYIPEFDGEGI